ncbi:hypothetical protein SAICODRAFT_69207 [Saitoella complicata NRRL Y-17804]|uniref:uncharacterized protein n=1 Tax=Saitoella complicata (strain BCRC 22490 / CBS 7301 / JCM 7358 / NBRC 10748 / NRRL Y-17804) TaxID=698492 RepID=UPI000866D7E9|nr:uncharacterized protein SAICODRAFT_69207 [Saitoella complicata NRRL Y-17804]ODQ55911.1 hypothetical protein SAICODRAFT_69207 [Saitoella complicata NRRL Y-17804]
MAVYSLFCALCGGPDMMLFDDSSVKNSKNDDYKNLERGDCKWLTKWRGIFVNLEWDETNEHDPKYGVTGAGKMCGVEHGEKGRRGSVSGFNCITVHGKSIACYVKDPEIDGSEIFPVHDACWQIAKDVLDQYKHKGRTVEHLYNFFDKHSADGHTQRVDYALYDGAEKNWGKFWEEHAGEEYMVTDPLLYKTAEDDTPQKERSLKNNDRIKRVILGMLDLKGGAKVTMEKDEIRKRRNSQRRMSSYRRDSAISGLRPDTAVFEEDEEEGGKKHMMDEPGMIENDDKWKQWVY